jgi:hypothetical protein
MERSILPALILMLSTAGCGDSSNGKDPLLVPDKEVRELAAPDSQVDLRGETVYQPADTQELSIPDVVELADVSPDLEADLLPTDHAEVMDAELAGPDVTADLTEVMEEVIPTVPFAVLGQWCQSDADCIEGYCVDAGEGALCLPLCDGDCFTGWECVDVLDISVCIPLWPAHCEPCSADSCPESWCRFVGWEGEFCLQPCTPGAPGQCPEGYLCTAEEDSPQSGVCFPEHNSCHCAPGEAGQLVPCSYENEFGSCPGQAYCDPEVGIIDCDAKVPQQDLCDKKDNNCNGAVDEFHPDKGKPCDGPDPDLCLTGVYTCSADGTKLVCSGEMPQVEKCDGKDNDCDGEVDESFEKKGQVCGMSPICGVGYFQCNALGKLVCVGAVPEVESCDGEDNDCDGLVDENFPDWDGNGVADCLE